MFFRVIVATVALYATTTSVDAFTSSSSRPSALLISSSLNLMSSTDIDRILADATACVEGECALDDVSALLTNLLAQQSLLSSRINEIDKLVSSLESSNGVGSGAERPVDEIRETVRAIFRIFSVGDKASGNNYPSLTKAMGYSGETSGGGKTAYDVLPPKPMKK